MIASAVSTYAADKPTVKKFPAPLQQGTFAKPFNKAPLNQDVDKGLKCYASTSILDYNSEPGVISFYSNSLYDFTKLGKCIDYNPNEVTEGLQLTRFIGGTYCTSPGVGGEYVGYLVERYSFVDYIRSYGYWDLETGEFEVLKDMSDLKDNFHFIEGMSTNPKNGKLMAVAHSKVTNPASSIGEVDPETGEYELIKELNEYYFDIAYDSDGNLWAYRWIWPNEADASLEGSMLVQLDEENGYAEKNPVRVKKDGSDFLCYYGATLCFDYTTGDLYVMATNSDANCYFAKLNTQTGEMVDPQYSYNLCTGLYIPFKTADSRQAANQVTNLKSELLDNGTKVKLTWTNPTTAWDNSPLTELAEVLVYRDDMDADPVATLNESVLVGKDMEWTDENASDGVHTYYVVPCRVQGEKGIYNSWEVFIGEDVPGAPKNITLTKQDSKTLVLKWEAPAEGATSGWYDATTLKYKITRYPDNTVVAEDATGNSFTDSNLGETHGYYYTILPYTAKGEGTPATSDVVRAGNAYEPNYVADMTSPDTANDWTPVDANADGYKFVYETYYQGYQISLSNNANADDYVLSPDLDLKGGNTYKVSFRINLHWRYDKDNLDTMHDFDITAGMGTTAADQTIVVESFRGFKNLVYDTEYTVEGYFTPQTDGVYNVGFHLLTQGVMDDITVKGASVENVYDNDLKVKAFTGNVDVVQGTPSDFNVDVFNAGNNASSNYAVKVCRLDGDEKVELGRTEVSETLAPFTSKTVVVSTTPDVTGAAKLVAEIEYTSDQYLDNNTSDVMDVNIQESDVVPFNETVLSEEWDSNTETPDVFDLKQDTRWPISLAKNYSNSESIYYPSDFQTPLAEYESVTINRMALEYSSNDGATIHDVPLTIYLGETDKKAYDTYSWGCVAATEWMPLENMTKVFDGTVSTTVGENNKLVIPFSEKFQYNPKKNLVMTIACAGNATEHADGNSYPILYNHFCVCDPNNYDTPVYRQVLYEGKTAPYDYVSEVKYCAKSYVPVLYLAIETLTGIESVKIGEGGAFGYDKASGSILLGGMNAQTVTVYNLSGQVVRSVGKAFNSKLNLSNGVYVVKAISADGNVVTRKIQVK